MRRIFHPLPLLSGYKSNSVPCDGFEREDSAVVYTKGHFWSRVPPLFEVPNRTKENFLGWWLNPKKSPECRTSTVGSRLTFLRNWHLCRAGTRFDFGQISLEDRFGIRLTISRPLLLRPVLLNSEVLDDDLHLMPRIRKKLLEDNYAHARGTSKALMAVYVDADELPRATRPSGTYAVDGDRVILKLVLRRDNHSNDRVEIQGSHANLHEFSERVVKIVQERLSKVASSSRSEVAAP